MSFSFFNNLYKDEESDQRGQSPFCEFEHLKGQDMDLLKLEVSMEEVKKALLDKGPYKAPGPNGFQPIFF